MQKYGEVGMRLGQEPLSRRELPDVSSRPAGERLDPWRWREGGRERLLPGPDAMALVTYACPVLMNQCLTLRAITGTQEAGAGL